MQFQSIAIAGACVLVPLMLTLVFLAGQHWEDFQQAIKERNSKRLTYEQIGDIEDAMAKLAQADRAREGAAISLENHLIWTQRQLDLARQSLGKIRGISEPYDKTKNS